MKENEELRKQLAAIAARVPARLSGEDKPRFIAAQAEAQKVAQAFGDSMDAPPPMHGELLPDYRRRLLTPYQKHSKRWKDKDLEQVHESVLDIAGEQIFADALDAANHPTDLPMGVLRRRTTTDQAGRVIHSFVGSDEGAAWREFMSPTRNLGTFLTARDRAS